MSLETVVLDPASLLVNRKAKQRKTDRIDAKKMVRALLAHHRGDAAVLSRVQIPSVEEEDRKRLLRERRRLVKGGGAALEDELLSHEDARLALDAGSAWTLCPHSGTIYSAPR